MFGNLSGMYYCSTGISGRFAQKAGVEGIAKTFEMLELSGLRIFIYYLYLILREKPQGLN